MSINIALVDAANNCARQGARATITLKSGVQFTGSLKHESGADLGTVHMNIESGWATIDRDEIAAVHSHR